MVAKNNSAACGMAALFQPHPEIIGVGLFVRSLEYGEFCHSQLFSVFFFQNLDFGIFILYDRLIVKMIHRGNLFSRDAV